MQFQNTICFFIICILSLGVCLALPEEERYLPRDVSDAFKIFEKFDFATAILDQDLDGDLDGLVGQRTNFDADARSATYEWIFGGRNGHEKQIFSLTAKQGETLDTLLVAVDFDYDHEVTERVAYTDYENCGVLEMPFLGKDECILWVTAEIKKDVPQNCQEQFEDICGIKTPVYDESCDEYGLKEGP